MIVEVRRQDRILVIAMNRPAKRNAVNKEMAEALSAALDLMDDDDELWAGVLTGTREFFCAGTDLKDGADARTERGGEYGIIRRRRRKPLIAAVEGACFGSGMEIAFACDLVVAATTARFALPESRRGLVPSSGALLRATRSLPIHLAKELMITGAELSGERAHHFGLVNRIAEPGAALEAAIDLAEDVCQSSPTAVQAILEALADQLDEADAVGWTATAKAVDRVVSSDDLQEGLAAFFERRPPRWVGR